MDDKTIDKMVEFSINLRKGRGVSYILSALLNVEFENICDMVRCNRACYYGRGCPNDERLFAAKDLGK